MTKRRSLATISVVLLILVAGAAFLYAARSQGPDVTVLVAPSPTAAPFNASPTPAPTPITSPVPTPEGFVLPQGCSYVAGPTPSSPKEWRFSCGGAPDSAQRAATALNQQGWAGCLPQPGGIGEWWKGAITTRVTEGRNASEPPFLLQYPRSFTNCP
jgi:hypothetical protein